MIKFYKILFLICIPAFSYSQVKDSVINIWQCELNYSFDMPKGDIANRFGNNSTVGLGLTYKTKHNWTAGFEVNYLFGGNLKDSSAVLNGIMTETGQIINKFGEYGSVLLTEKGFYVGGKVGRVFPVLGPNKNSGIVFNVGAGLLQYKTRIENKDNNTPPVLNDYKKGYDHLTNGLSAREFIGYQFLDNKNLFNFYFGLEFYQAWTKCRRDYNFDLMGSDDVLKHDYLFGIRAGWIVPIYTRTPNKYYYY